MLELRYSSDWVNNRDGVLLDICREASQGFAGRLLLVPEQFSHDMERKLCAFGGDTISRYAEVLSFTRLAGRVFDRTGGGARETLDAGGRVGAMASAVEQLRSRLKSYAAASARPEFLSEMIRAVDEFKSCRVSAQDLRRASLDTQGLLAQKLEELSLLLEGYDALCAQGKMDPRDRMTLLAERLAESSFAKGKKIYIDGFSDFTTQEMEIIALLLEQTDVIITINCDALPTLRPEFATGADTARKLLNLAGRLGIKSRTIAVETQIRTAAAQVAEGLFSKAPQPLDAAEGLHSYRCGDLWAECRAVAGRILELVTGGARFRDIAVACADPDPTAPVLSMVMRRYGIAAYFSGTEDILHKSVIHMVVTAVQAAVEGLEQMDVLRYLKSALSPLPPALCHRLENYAIVWGIRGKAWQQPFAHHPQGLQMPWTEDDHALLAQLEEARQTAVVPLCELNAALKAAPNTRAMVLATYEFVTTIGLRQRLEDMALDLESRGDRRGSQELQQLWEILLGALEQLEGLLGDSVRAPDSYQRLLQLILSQYDVGTIPDTLDSVTVGSIENLRRRECRHLILMNAQEGLFPSAPSAQGVLTQAERSWLEHRGLLLSGGQEQAMDRQLAGIYAVLRGARESVTLTCGGEPAFLLRRFEGWMGKEGGETPPDPLGFDRWEAAGVLPSQVWPDSLNADAEALRRRVDYAFGTVGRSTVERLYGKRLMLSASQIDKAASCRFAYFMRYGLRARERKEARVDPAQFGTFVHYVLEHTAQEVGEHGGFPTMELEPVLSIARKHMTAYTKEFFEPIAGRTQRETYLFQRNLEEVELVVEQLWQELRQSSFQPSGYEVTFGPGEGSLPAIDVPNGSMPAQIRGAIDRVDTWQGYFRVVDYKTGSKDFDYCDILTGVGLQMLIYLFALEQLDQGKGAGVLYFPARIPLESAADVPEEGARKLIRRQGLLLADEDLLTAMENSEAFKLLPCKRKKDGSLSGDLGTREQFQKLKDYVFDTVAALVDQISGGNVDPNPYVRGGGHDACRFCEFSAACHLADYGTPRVRRAVSQEGFWQEIEGRNHHG